MAVIFFCFVSKIDLRVNRTVKRQNLFYLIFFLGGWLKRTGYLLHFSFFLYLIWKQPFQVVVYGTLQKRKEKTNKTKSRAGFTTEQLPMFRHASARPICEKNIIIPNELFRPF